MKLIVIFLLCFSDQESNSGDKSIINLSLRSKLKQLRFIGRMIGFAVCQDLLLNLHLSKPFVKQVWSFILSLLFIIYFLVKPHGACFLKLYPATRLTFFPLFFFMSIYDNEYESKENKNWTRDKIDLQHIDFYYIDKSVLVENRPLVKFIGNYIRDSSGVFSVSSLVRILMMSFPALTLLFVQKYSCPCNKKKITRRREDMNFIFSW